jgi:hypothetical protein
MNTKTFFLIFIFTFFAFHHVQAQELNRKMNLQSFSSSFQEALKIDFSKSPDMMFPNHANRLPQRANNGWYPVKAELYYIYDTVKSGDASYTIGTNGLLDKRIVLGCNPNIYDSTVMVFNRTPYSFGKNLADTTYNYKKKTNGLYVLDARRTHCYHYYDHFDGDSLYYEYLLQFWNDANKQWNNYYRYFTGFHDTLVEFVNRSATYFGVENLWKLQDAFYDSISYNNKGFVDTLYQIVQQGNNIYRDFKIAFTIECSKGLYLLPNYYMVYNK